MFTVRITTLNASQLNAWVVPKNPNRVPRGCINFGLSCTFISAYTSHDWRGHDFLENSTVRGFFTFSRLSDYELPAVFNNHKTKYFLFLNGFILIAKKTIHVLFKTQLKTRHKNEGNEKRFPIQTNWPLLTTWTRLKNVNVKTLTYYVKTLTCEHKSDSRNVYKI